MYICRLESARILRRILASYIPIKYYIPIFAPLNPPIHPIHPYKVIFFHGHHGEMMVVPAWVRLIGDKIRDRAGARG